MRLLNKLSKHHTSLSLAELASEAYDKLFEGVTKESIAEQLRLSPELCYLAFYVFQVTGIVSLLKSANVLGFGGPRKKNQATPARTV